MLSIHILRMPLSHDFFSSFFIKVNGVEEVAR